MLDKKAKEHIIKKFKVHEHDTGSPQVQIAILTEEIKRLTDHLKLHKQDFSSRRGLMKKVGERRRLLRYLEKTDEQSFDDLTQKLKIKIAKRKRWENDLLFKEEEEEEIENQVLEEEGAKAKSEEE